MYDKNPDPEAVLFHAESEGNFAVASLTRIRLQLEDGKLQDARATADCLADEVKHLTRAIDQLIVLAAKPDEADDEAPAGAS